MADVANATQTPAPAAAATPAAKKAKSGGVAKKPRGKPAHPRTSEMVNSAIKSLKERGGSSLQAIKKYISANYKVDAEKLAPFIKKYLKSAVTSGELVQTKGKGASGSFKLASSASKPEGGNQSAGKGGARRKAGAAKKAGKPKTAAKRAAPAAAGAAGAATPAKKKSPKKKPAAKKAAAKSPKSSAPKVKKASAAPKAKKVSKVPTKKPKAPKPKKAAAKPKASPKKATAARKK